MLLTDTGRVIHKYMKEIFMHLPRSCFTSCNSPLQENEKRKKKKRKVSISSYLSLLDRMLKQGNEIRKLIQGIGNTEPL